MLAESLFFIDGLDFEGIPVLLAQQALLVLLGLEPLVQAVLVESVHAGALHSLARDVGVVHAHAVVANRNQLVLADVAVLGGLVAHPTGHRVPLHQLEERLRLH